MTTWLFLEPLDVLYLRGNRLFGEAAGDFGAALMPPWPSLAAGAIRSRMLVDGGVDPAAFAGGEAPPGALGEVLGTPAAPGSFRLTQLTLGFRSAVGVEPCFPLPDDVVVTRPDLDGASYLQPTAPHGALRTSACLPALPLLRADAPAKPVRGLWLNGAGLRAYLEGAPLGREHLLGSADLWQLDPRLGIALDPARGRVAEGKLYTTETVALRQAGAHSETGREGCGTGFLVGVADAGGLSPTDGLLRLGGDGRGAAVTVCEPAWPAPDWERIERERRFRLVLSTPGLFEGGWRPAGLGAECRWSDPDGCTAQLTAAVVGRGETVSGWDLARRQPKNALRAAPTGSVYWFEGLEGGTTGLRKLAEEGFWAVSGYPDRMRRAEGFNNVLVAAWPAARD